MAPRIGTSADPAIGHLADHVDPSEPQRGLQLTVHDGEDRAHVPIPALKLGTAIAKASDTTGCRCVDSAVRRQEGLALQHRDGCSCTDLGRNLDVLSEAGPDQLDAGGAVLDGTL